MTVICRDALDADVPELVGLMEQLGYNVVPEQLLKVMEAIRQRQGAVFVAEADGRVVGCLNAIVDVRLAEGVTGEIASLVINEDYRGLGIGKGLVRHAEQWFQGRVAAIRIRANSKRTQAHALYASLGFARVKEQTIFIKRCQTPLRD